MASSGKVNLSLYSDISPIDTVAADGPDPLAFIQVSDHFRDVHGIFYALVQENELSERAYLLTTEVIKLNSANYSAWQWRRNCIVCLGFKSFIFDELNFTFNWIKSSPKNYQVWFHRRWLIDQITKTSSLSSEEKQNLVIEEFDFLDQALDVDAKNYNCFSHRVFLFDLTASSLSIEDRVLKELEFCTRLIAKDVRNNSAWSYRRQALKKLHNPLPYDVVADEIRFTLEMISLAPNNESPWVYLRSFHGWQAFPHVKTSALSYSNWKVEEEREAGIDGLLNRFALQTLLDLAIYHRENAHVEKIFELLETKADSIRAKYWRFVRSSQSNSSQ